MPQRTDRVPALGEDSEAIVAELGLTEAEISALRALGVIGAAGANH